MDDINCLIHNTPNLESLQNILLDGMLKVGGDCPIKTVSSCKSAVYLTVVFKENIGTELPPGEIYLVFSPNILEETNQYHLSTGIFYGDFSKGESYGPHELKSFVNYEKKKFSRLRNKSNKEILNNNELVLYEGLPLHKHLIGIWITSPGPQFLQRIRSMTDIERILELATWDGVRKHLVTPPKESFQSEVIDMMKYSGLSEYLDILTFPAEIPDLFEKTDDNDVDDYDEYDGLYDTS